jgi:hypothetical protein
MNRACAVDGSRLLIMVGRLMLYLVLVKELFEEIQMQILPGYA